MNDDEIKTYIQHIKSRLSITKTVATRTVKTSKGDFFVGYSAAWNTVQDDGVQGMESLMDSADESASGMTLQDAKVAQYLLAMQVDIAAHEAALANGAISAQMCQDTLKNVRSNYGKLIRMAVGDVDPIPAKEASV